MFQWSSKGTSNKFKGSFKKFLCCFKIVSREFQWYFIGSQKVSQGSLKGIKEVYGGFQKCSKKEASKFKWCFKWILRLFEKCLNGVSLLF